MYDNSSFWKTKRRSEKREANDGLKLFILGRTKRRFKRNVFGVAFTTVSSKWWAKIVQYVAILGLNLCLSQREMVTTTKKNLRFLSCLPYFGPILWFMWLSLGLFALVGKNIVHFSTILR